MMALLTVCSFEKVCVRNHGDCLSRAFLGTDATAFAILKVYHRFDLLADHVVGAEEPAEVAGMFTGFGRDAPAHVDDRPLNPPRAGATGITWA
jgi:hypothetical protein